MSYADLHGMSEIPSIAYFCSLFSQAFGVQDIEIQDLEDALLHRANSEDMFDNVLLDNLIVSLLRGCLPSYKTVINQSNYSTYLRTLITTKIEEYEEEDIPVNVFNPFNTEEEEDFDELNLQDKVKVLKQLTEFRLEADDVPDKIKDIPVDSLRIEPLGVDSDGVVYWYFFGTRLYKEIVKKRRQPKEDKAKAGQKEKVEKGKKKKKPEVVKDNNEEEEEGDNEIIPPGWYLACQTENDWNNLVKAFSKSKKKAEKELYSVLSENFLPDVVKMFQDKEREDRIRILMLNKRSSSRIDKKKQAEERREEEERKREEIQREKKEKENHRKAERAKKLEEEERVRRLTERELKRSLQQQQQQQQLQVEERRKRTRLDEELRRRVERDHDYLGWNKRPGGRKAAAAEWNRLQFSEDESQTVRSIRF